MSIFQMPKTVKSRLDHLQRSFLWGGASLEKKTNSVNWAIVCLEKRSRVLGVKDLRCLNKSLNGVGDLQQKGGLCGMMLLVGRKRENGVPVR